MKERVAGEDRGRGDGHVRFGTMHLEHGNAAETRIDHQAALDVSLVSELVAEDELRLEPVTDQVFDHSGVGPGQQRVEIFPFASHLSVELVVALGRQDNHGTSIGLDYGSNVGRESAELP